MDFYMTMLIIGVTIVATGIITFFASNNKIIPSIMIGIGSFIIAFSVYSNKFDFNERINNETPSKEIEMLEKVSLEVGMDIINYTNEDLENLNKNINTKLYFKDGENIFLCDVVYENNERNYYFTSGGKTIPLNKFESVT